MTAVKPKGSIFKTLMLPRRIFCWLTVGSVVVLGVLYMSLDWIPSRSHERSIDPLRPIRYFFRASPTFKSGTGRDKHQNYEPLRRLYPELFEKVPDDFLKQYKNPCWLDETSKKLRCLPYFYQIGFQKCGTTDLWDKLVQHPQVQNVPKEPHWWSWRRNGWTGTPIHRAEVERVRNMTKMKDDSSLDWYLNWYELFAIPAIVKDNQLVFGDASISTAIEPLSKRTSLFPGASEPPYTLPDLIHSVQPLAKIVAIVRDPVSRCYSNYLYAGGQNATTFHDAAEEGIHCFLECAQEHSNRSCAYSPSGRSCWGVRPGIYNIFLSDWIKTFGWDKVYVIRLDDWTSSAVEQYKNLIAFLELDPLPDSDIEVIVGTSIKNAWKKKERVGDMWNSTRKILRDFYRPHNYRLAKLMNSSKYLWDYG